MYQSWVQALTSAQVAGAALSNTTTATSILPAQAKFTIPSNILKIGDAMRITAAYQLSNIVTTPGTLTLDIRLGGTVVFNGGAMQLSTTAHTSLPLWVQILLTVRAVGSSANIMGQMVAMSQALSISGADPTTGHSLLLAPNTAPAVGTNFDSTATQQLDHFATFSSAQTGNAITCQQFVLEHLT